jgi:molybdenum cofactor synthesis domain-containing protein
VFEVGIIIVSDRAASGERADGCLAVFAELLEGGNFQIADRVVVSDEPDDIRRALKSQLNQRRHLILTSGGTGCGLRDNTPEVTREIIEKPTPGIDEAIRSFSAQHAPFAFYSRAVSGIAGRSLIINLPGSPRAVKEVMGFLLPTIEHPLKLLADQIEDCREEIERHDRA